MQQPEHAATKRPQQRPRVMEMPSFLNWLRRQPEATQVKHMRGMLRKGHASPGEVAREFRRLHHLQERA
jgi:hypothetical protein